MTAPHGPWALRADVTITDHTGATATAVVPVRATEPVFEGHYPGYPVLPGVCVVECGHRAALAAPPDGRAGLDLVAIDSARFLDPVLPGDDLSIELGWSADGDEWCCRAEVRTARARAGTLRLRYRAARPTGPGEPPEPVAAEPGRTLDADEIAALIPHRRPVLLLDRVDSLVPGTRLTASRTIRADEPWSQGPRRPYPAALLVESWCQAAGVLAVHDAPLAGRAPVLLLGSVQGAALAGPVFPGDRVEHRVRMATTTGDTAVLTGQSCVAGRVVLRMRRIVVALRSAAEPEVVG